VIPLGLGRKLYRPPFMTALVVLAILVLYRHQPSDLAYFISTSTSAAKHGVRRAEVALFNEFCLARRGDARGCGTYSLLVGSRHFEVKTAPKAAKDDDALIERLTSERKKVAELERRLRGARRGDPDFRYRDILTGFYAGEDKRSRVLAGLPSFRGYRKAFDGYYKDVRGVQRHDHMLSPLNRGFDALFFAQFRHGGLGHLLGNLLALIAFGIYVEQRVNFLVYLFVYLVGGTFAVYAQTLVPGDPTLRIVGASGNIAAAMGLFFVLFFHNRLRVVVPLGFAFPRVDLPVKFALPLMFMISDLVGAFGVEDFKQGGGVAHIAHLGGFAIGALVGLAVNAMSRLPHGYLYPWETESVRRLISERSLRGKLALARRLLRINDGNDTVRMHALSAIFKAWRTSGGAQVATPDVGAFIARELGVALTSLFESGRLGDAHRLCALAPHDLSLGEAVVLQEPLLKLADHALGRGDALTALRLYDAFGRRYPTAGEARNVHATIKSMVGAMQAHAQAELLATAEGCALTAPVLQLIAGARATVAVEAGPLPPALPKIEPGYAVAAAASPSPLAHVRARAPNLVPAEPRLRVAAPGGPRAG
jgi:membrane associated rhomboid family serine protease